MTSTPVASTVDPVISAISSSFEPISHATSSFFGIVSPAPSLAGEVLENVRSRVAAVGEALGMDGDRDVDEEMG